jgi:hypothetical protein
MRSLALLAAASLAGALPGCGGGATMPAPPDLCGASFGSGPPHAIAVAVALSDDGQGVKLFTQNGSTVHVPTANLAGKSYYWATAKGGDSIFNAKMIDLGAGAVAPDLSARFTTPAHYPDGPYELALFISVTGGDPTKGPQPGDLASFDLTAPPPCDPPVTGVSVRVDVAGGDAQVTLTNRYFIRF